MCTKMRFERKRDQRAVEFLYAPRVHFAILFFGVFSSTRNKGALLLSSSSSSSRVCVIRIVKRDGRDDKRGGGGDG